MEQNKEQIEKALDEAFDSLDEKTQDFILGDEYISIVSTIEKVYSLSNEESRQIQLLTLLSLHNLYETSKIKDALILALRNRSAAEAEKIIKEVEDKILIHRS